MLALTQGMMSLAAAGGSGFNAYVATLSPLAWWRLDSGAASGNPMADSSGNGYDGTLNSGAFSSGITGGAGLAGGRAGIAGAATNAALILGGSSSGAWSVSMFLNVPSTGSPNDYAIDRGTNQFAIIYGFVAGTFEVFSPGASNNPRPSSAMAVSGTGLHHVVYTYNNGTFRGYLNGTQVFSTAISFSLPTGSGVWTIGASGANGNLYDGAIYDVQLYSRALNAAEVSGMWGQRDTL